MNQKRATSDKHHIFGVANSPIYISTPINDHRAFLSTAQYNWPRKTLENKYGSPILVDAAKIRGFGDFIVYFYQEHILPVAEHLEQLDTSLTRKHGKSYWKKMKLRAFEPKTQ